MSEVRLNVQDGQLFVRHSEIRADRSSVVCLHGLGESGLSFAEAFDRPELAGFNLIVPDLLGFGRSSMAGNGNYSFRSQTERIWSALDQLGIPAAAFVGHSMGGDLATLMAAWDDRARVKGLVNVEGNLTPDDLFISRSANEAAEGRFAEWFEDFRWRWVQGRPSHARYFASLMVCRPEAFRESARELVRRNPLTAGSTATEVGSLFRSLSIPRVFCWGSDLCEGSQLFLRDARVCNRQFADASHWVMVDRPGEFYPFLRELLALRCKCG